MKPAAPLQSIVDPFVTAIQGELVSNLVGNDNPPSSADYLFRQHNVIAELKALEADSFGESFRRKLGNAQRTGNGKASFASTAPRASTATSSLWTASMSLWS